MRIELDGGWRIEGDRAELDELVETIRSAQDEGLAGFRECDSGREVLVVCAEEAGQS